MRISDWSSDVCSSDLKRAECRGDRSKVTWTQVETGSAITWKYPSCVLLGDDSTGEFHPVALTHHRQQADTGTKMIHVGKRTKSKIISKGISAGRGQNTYRGLVKVAASARSEEHTSALQSLMRISYAVFCLKKKKLLKNVNRK